MILLALLWLAAGLAVAWLIGALSENPVPEVRVRREDFVVIWREDSVDVLYERRGR